MSGPSRARFHQWLRDIADAELRRPAITLAFAQSVNGTMTRLRGTPTQLSSTESSGWTHQLRGMHAGIAVGVETVLSDDPRLTCRNGSGASPIPLIFDSTLRTPPEAKLFQEHPRVLVATTREAVEERGGRYPEQLQPIIVGSREGAIGDALAIARGEYGVDTLMVEGGAALLHGFLRHGFYDLLSITVASRFLSGYQIGGEGVDETFDLRECHILGGDLLVIGSRKGTV